jgi:hypothetical protein
LMMSKQSWWKSSSRYPSGIGHRRPLGGVSDFLCLSHTLDQEAEYGDQERDFG